MTDTTQPEDSSPPPLPVRRTLTVLARDALREQRKLDDLQRTEWLQQNRLEAVTCAAADAVTRLGEEAAAQLSWEAVDTADPEVAEAVAKLPERVEFDQARLRWRHGLGEDAVTTLYLVRECDRCRTVREDAVTDLAGLGELLAAGLSGGRHV